MSGFDSMMVTLKNDGMVELAGKKIQYWEGYGLPTYEGTIEGLKEDFPEIVEELLERKIIKNV